MLLTVIFFLEGSLEELFSFLLFRIVSIAEVIPGILIGFHSCGILQLLQHLIARIVVADDGSIVNMGLKNEDGSVCYIIGVLKSIRDTLHKGDLLDDMSGGVRFDGRR